MELHRARQHLHAADGKVRAHIHKARLDDINRVFDELEHGKVDGRIVLDLE